MVLLNESQGVEEPEVCAAKSQHSQLQHQISALPAQMGKSEGQLVLPPDIWQHCRALPDPIHPFETWVMRPLSAASPMDLQVSSQTPLAFLPLKDISPAPGSHLPLPWLPWMSFTWDRTPSRGQPVGSALEAHPPAMPQVTDKCSFGLLC